MSPTQGWNCVRGGGFGEARDERLEARFEVDFSSPPPSPGERRGDVSLTLRVGVVEGAVAGASVLPEGSRSPLAELG